MQENLRNKDLTEYSAKYLPEMTIVNLFITDHSSIRHGLYFLFYFVKQVYSHNAHVLDATTPFDNKCLIEK